METFEFSQDEIGMILGFINKAVQQGGLGLADLLAVAPAAQKLKEKLKPAAAPTEEKKDEPVFKNN